LARDKLRCSTLSPSRQDGSARSSHRTIASPSCVTLANIKGDLDPGTPKPLETKASFESSVDGVPKSLIAKESFQNMTEEDTPGFHRSPSDLESNRGSQDRYSDVASEVGDDMPHNMNEMNAAKKTLERRRRSKKKYTDPFYASYLTARSVPLPSFFADVPPKWALTITSINEAKLLRAMGLPQTERR